MTDATPFVVFVVAVIGMFVCLLANVRIPVPTAISSNGRLRIDYIIPPLIGVIVLLISGSMTFEEVWRGGVVGDKDIRPYVIIILFNALAYICVSLDATGCLTFISLKVAQAAGSSRKRLFVYFFTLASVMTSVTSNDIVIMTLTPVVLQCAKFTGTKPWAYLFAQFFAANSCSYILVIGNPTNIIVADAFKISFAEFSKTMIVPVLVSVNDYNCACVMIVTMDMLCLCLSHGISDCQLLTVKSVGAVDADVFSSPKCCLADATVLLLSLSLLPPLSPTFYH